VLAVTYRVFFWFFSKLFCITSLSLLHHWCIKHRTSTYTVLCQNFSFYHVFHATFLLFQLFWPFIYKWLSYRIFCSILIKHFINAVINISLAWSACTLAPLVLCLFRVLFIFVTISLSGIRCPRARVIYSGPLSMPVSENFYLFDIAV